MPRETPLSPGPPREPAAGDLAAGCDRAPLHARASTTGPRPSTTSSRTSSARPSTVFGVEQDVGARWGGLDEPAGDPGTDATRRRRGAVGVASIEPRPMSRAALTLSLVQASATRCSRCPFALMGAWLAAGGPPEPARTLAWIVVLAAVAARTAAMAFNRRRRPRASTRRTRARAGRELPSGALTGRVRARRSSRSASAVFVAVRLRYSTTLAGWLSPVGPRRAPRATAT